MDERQIYKQIFGRPNIILIHTDQQRADCVNSYGRRQGLYTPHQDSIGYQGVRFDSCYAPCPVCIPQRLSLLTGQSAHRHGVMANIGIPDLELSTTLPEALNQGGYQTALIGRTMHTYPFSRPYGFTDYLPGDPSNNEPDDAHRAFIRENAPKGCGGYNGNGSFNNSRFAAPFHLDSRFHQTMWATNEALDYIHSHRNTGKPYFLCVGYYAPHTPHNPPKEWLEHYLAMYLPDDPAIADYDVKPVTSSNQTAAYVSLEGEELRMARAGYYGNISFIDAQVGRIVNECITMPNTYVIFTSDHGEMLGDHYHVHKQMPYQGAVHTPLMIMGPGIAGNRVIDTPIAWQDLMPTILELAGLPIPDSVDGVSFAKTLLGQSEEKEREYLHGESKVGAVRFHGYEGQETEGNLAYEDGFHYLTDGKMKYIWFTKSGREQLFDVINDYQELHDLSGDAAYQDELQKWRQWLIAEPSMREEGLSNGESLICGPQPPLTPEMQRLCDQRLDEGRQVAYYYRQKI